MAPKKPDQIAAIQIKLVEDNLYRKSVQNKKITNSSNTYFFFSFLVIYPKYCPTIMYNTHIGMAGENIALRFVLVLR